MARSGDPQTSHEEPTICGALHPTSHAVCELDSGHKFAHYSHVIDWAWRPVCGAAHPKNIRETCAKPRGHRGGHANTRWWWSA